MFNTKFEFQVMIRVVFGILDRARCSTIVLNSYAVSTIVDGMLDDLTELIFILDEDDQSHSK